MDQEKTTYSPQAWYILVVLTIAYVLSFIDRNIMALLVGPIREAFDISDFQFSLLHGFAFTLFYIVLGLPLGWLADRFSRKWIITTGVGLWSLMTALCGFAQSFFALFLARVGVGVGEAALSPPTYSMLGDLFAPGRLRWATAIFGTGITIGSGSSYLIGGWLYEKLVAIGTIEIPSLGWSFEPWQVTFVAVGLPGLFVVLALLVVREPARRSTYASKTAEQPMPLQEVMAELKARWRAYVSIILGMSGMAVVGYGVLIWYPEFLLRSFGTSKAEAGSWLGMIFIVLGTAGTFAGAWFADRLQKAGYEDANVRLIGLLAAGLVLPAGLAPLAPTDSVALMLVAVVTFFHYAHFGVGMAGLQLVTPNRMRALISALLLFSTNLFGLMLGGSIVAFFTDFVFGADQFLNRSLATVAFVVYPLTAIIVFWGLKHYRRALL